jgi:hypothetical protein
MNLYFKIYRANMMRLPKLETIFEEVLDREPLHIESQSEWKTLWYKSGSKELYNSGWDQWVIIDIIEPSSPPPDIS